MDVPSDILWLESFEAALGKDQHQVYLQASNELLGGVGRSAEYYAANPLALLDANLAGIPPPKLNCLLRCLRYWRWRSRHVLDSHSIVEAQDKLIVRSLTHSIAAMARSSDPSIDALALEIGYFLNALFLENNNLAKSMLVSREIPSEAVPFLVEHIPSLHTLIDSIPELLAGKGLYNVDLIAWLALKYPLPKFNGLHNLIITWFVNEAQGFTAFDDMLKLATIAARLCLALPSLFFIHLSPVLVSLLERSHRLPLTAEQATALDLRKAQMVASIERASQASGIHYKAV